ncbi:GTPase Obg [Verrucomicrobiales bacterium]|nr:GTPase Obg [Verrucomicrobiales bacterium]
MFVDHIKIFAKAGDGGNGCMSFRREAHVPKGGPDGGDGGKGGDVILVVDQHTDNLRNFFYTPNHKAERGVHGKGQRKTGRGGKNLVLKVPPGTIVYRTTPNKPKPKPGDLDFEEDYTAKDWAGEFVEDEGQMVLMNREEGIEDEKDAETETVVQGEIADTEFGKEIAADEAEAEEEANSGESMMVEDDDTVFDEEEDEIADNEVEEDDVARSEYGELIVDLTEVGQKFVLCKGGIGGKGNWNFRTDTNQAPIEFTPGEKGDEDHYYLELRQIADVGLVGFPNAGKSTLLTALSKATPKVAAYPFTTLKPMVGVVDFPGFMRCTVADIPGLIEGAHDDVGLGHDFLRHISRCAVFLFVVDTAGVDQRDPISDIQILRKELRLYDEELGEREWLIVANKTDLEESEMYLNTLQYRFPKQEIFPISAQTGDGLEALKKRLCEMVGSRPT